MPLAMTEGRSRIQSRLPEVARGLVYEFAPWAAARSSRWSVISGGQLKRAATIEEPQPTAV